jgi:hypothetical protein
MSVWSFLGLKPCNSLVQPQFFACTYIKKKVGASPAVQVKKIEDAITKLGISGKLVKVLNMQHKVEDAIT